MINRLTLISILLLLTGCAAWHNKPVTVSVFDFSASQQRQQDPSPARWQSRKSILIVDTTAPSWLDNTAIHYRLAYHNPAQSYNYANSRWIAPPAAILTQKIRNRIVSDTTGPVIKNSSMAKADVLLNTELTEFIQIFDGAHDSHVMINLRASLVDRTSRQLLAQKDFAIRETTPSADATGAVASLTTSSDRLIGELILWLSTVIPAN